MGIDMTIPRWSVFYHYFISMNKRKPARYWTYDRCLEEAKKYKFKADFKKEAAGAYDAAKDKGWLTEYVWLESLPRIKWTYETCYEEAKKYKTRSEFAKKAGAAYRIARQNGWSDEYIWFMDIIKPCGFWNYETCYVEAKKYMTRAEFSEKSQTAYQVARRNKWLDNYSWFVSESTPAGFWTYEKCYEAAKKYKTRDEFNKKDSKAYAAAYRHGWLDDYIWFEKKFKWTYDECLAVAKRFKTKREFELGHKGAYTAAVRYGWIKQFDWMVKNRVNVISENVDNVYMYYFEKYDAVYVGRTINKKRRDREHIFNTESDAVARFAMRHNIAVPSMIILEENLTLEKGQEREDYWVNYYKEQGYNILNSGRTGVGLGSLGSLAGIKWTKDKCFEEAKKYSYRKEFQRGSVGAYTRALKRGWLKEYTWFKRPQSWNQKWNQESCYDEALKYKSIDEFREQSNRAYSVALKNKWLIDYTWLKESSKKPHHYWNYETCYREAQKYKSRSEFEYGKGSGGAYQTARKNGWLDDYTWLEKKQKPKGYWKYETCYEEAKKYKGRCDFMKHAPRAYKVAKTEGWIEDYTWFVIFSKPSGYWNFEKCKAEASKYETRMQFKKGMPGAYNKSRQNGWLDEFFPKKKFL